MLPSAPDTDTQAEQVGPTAPAPGEAAIPQQPVTRSAEAGAQGAAATRALALREGKRALPTRLPGMAVYIWCVGRNGVQQHWFDSG